MCNAFNTARQPDEVRLSSPPGQTRLVRRTDPAPVILPSGEVVMMRWGFQRKGLGPVNNTRSDKFDRPMWREAIRERRCLIPLASYYEWSGPTGQKTTHLFHHPQDQWLVAGGLWEESHEFGPCFSMITTEAGPVTAPIHHRMPALLSTEAQETYLREGPDHFTPAEGPLVTRITANPLIKNPPSHIQDELF